MKNLIFLILPFLFSCQTEKAASKYSAQVGDIIFDENLDDPNFRTCLNEKFTFQYYNDLKGFQFKGEKIEIERKLEALNLQGRKNSNGYITIRFLVNCEGKTGMFRVQQMNENYKEITFDKKLTSQLLEFTKRLTGWIPKEYLGKKINYHQYLTYKIENGKVSEILP